MTKFQISDRKLTFLSRFDLRHGDGSGFFWAGPGSSELTGEGVDANATGVGGPAMAFSLPFVSIIILNEKDRLYPVLFRTRLVAVDSEIMKRSMSIRLRV